MITSNVRKGLQERLDRIVPVREASADTYFKLAGAWIAIGGFIGYETMNWAEKGHIADPVTALGATATALVAGGAGALWDRAQRSLEVEEVNEYL